MRRRFWLRAAICRSRPDRAGAAGIDRSGTRLCASTRAARRAGPLLRAVRPVGKPHRLRRHRRTSRRSGVFVAHSGKRSERARSGPCGHLAANARRDLRAATQEGGWRGRDIRHPHGRKNCVGVSLRPRQKVRLITERREPRPLATKRAQSSGPRRSTDSVQW